MKHGSTDPDDLPNGAGTGDTTSNAPDTASGGSPDEPGEPRSTEIPDA